MHGRVKTRSTAEQEEVKKKERAKKVKLYKAGIDRVFKKREDGFLDMEVLEISAQLLCGNPDIYTVWNIRREVLLRFEGERSREDLQHLLENELLLTEQCLRANPKSYGAWHHRAWVLDTMPSPNWKKELVLCNKYLELDERNFHTWDYRRFVVKRANVSPQDEFTYSTQKISSNFSNYSSWHYRSSLIPLIYPDSHGKRPVREDKHKEELELVQNAAFTDPNDQSAWFYQRWLLGRAHQSLALVQAFASETLIFVALNKSIRLNQSSSKAISLELTVAGTLIHGSWAASGNHSHSYVWIFKSEKEVSAADITAGPIVISLYEEKKCTDQLILQIRKSGREALAFRKPQFDAQFGQGITSVLENELESCLQLLELEPDSKWTLLTTVLLMQAIDRNQYQKDTMQKLNLLEKTDILRSAYYKDLRSRYEIEYILDNQLRDGNLATDVNLSGHELTALFHLNYLSLLQYIDLSNNNLVRSLPQLHVLLCCQVLILDENLLESLDGMPSLPCLHTLSVKNNRIASKESIKQLQVCKCLSVVEFSGNPVVNMIDFSEFIQQLFPNLKI